MRTFADRSWPVRHPLGIYLILVGIISAGATAVARCGHVETMRYDLLSLVGGAGLAAWAFATESRRLIRWAEVALVLVWATASGAGHGAVWAEYTSRHPPVVAKNLVVRHMEARGIRYARADYWMSYWITFATNERIVVDSTERDPRITMYRGIVDEHAAEAVFISRKPCGDTKAAFGDVYFCPP
jgi:hypothetical protein